MTTFDAMIQIIEDDLVTCEIMTALLRRLHYPSRVAHTGEEAIEQLQTLPIDLIILDMMLPDMHGLGLLQYKHTQPHLRDIPVVCCTAQADIETVEAAMGLGAIDFIKKPIAVDAFAERITRAMERSPARWESSSELSKRVPFHGAAAQPMLELAQQVLRELEDALRQAQDSEEQGPSTPALDALVARAHGAALNVGALRTAHQLNTLWHGGQSPSEIEHLRSALIIELARFDEAIRNENANSELESQHG